MNGETLSDGDYQPLTARARHNVNRTVVLVLPALALFVIFFAIPVLLLFAIAFNRSQRGVVTFQISSISLANFERFFSDSLFFGALANSLVLAILVASLCLLLGYPVAYTIAKSRSPQRTTLYTTLVLISMQLDPVIRAFGLMVLLGDNGLINGSLIRAGWIKAPFPLMYNWFGTVVGLVQNCLPFMVLALIGILRSVNPSVEEAARSLGASRWQTFFRVSFPLTLPGVLSGFLLVFSLAISSYSVPVLMGGWKVLLLPLHIYQQIAERANFQFGASIAFILFLISTVSVTLYHRMTQRTVGGLV